jgi:hypothetical protein
LCEWRAGPGTFTEAEATLVKHLIGCHDRHPALIHKTEIKNGYTSYGRPGCR